MGNRLTQTDRIPIFGGVLILACVNILPSILGEQNEFHFLISISLIFCTIAIVNTILFLSCRNIVNRNTYIYLPVFLFFFSIIVSWIFVFGEFERLDIDHVYSKIFFIFFVTTLPIIILLQISLIPILNGCILVIFKTFSRIFLDNLALPAVSFFLVFAIYFWEDDISTSIIYVVLFFITTLPVLIVFSLICLFQYVSINLLLNNEGVDPENPAPDNVRKFSINLKNTRLFITNISLAFVSVFVLSTWIVSLLNENGLFNFFQFDVFTPIFWSLAGCAVAAATQTFFLARQPKNRLLKLWARWHWAFFVPPLLSAMWLILTVEDFKASATLIILLLLSLTACVGSVLNIHRNLVGLLNAYLFLALICYAAFS